MKEGNGTKYDSRKGTALVRVSGKASLGLSELRPDVRDEETVQRSGGNLKSK